MFRQIAVLVGFAFAAVSAFNAKPMSTRRQTSLTMAVDAKSTYKVVLLPGDGIGPEIMAATLPVLEAIGKKGEIEYIAFPIHKDFHICSIYNKRDELGGFKFEFTEADIGGIALDRHNDPFPDSSLATCRAADSILLACIGGKLKMHFFHTLVLFFLLLTTEIIKGTNGTTIHAT